MTIASCYVSPEGIVLGADSTTTYGDPNGNHYYNHGQKLFEIGENSTLGLVCWGMGGLPHVSYRTLVASLSDDLAATPATSVTDVCNRWATQFWAAYQHNNPLVTECRALAARPPYDANADPPAPNALTQAESDRLTLLSQSLEVGFCIGGYLPPDRTPQACQVLVRPLANAPIVVPVVGWAFWGAPNMIQRLLFGIDAGLKAQIVQSPHWTGTEADLNALAADHVFSHPFVPMREAVDFVHACISSTIKAMKFSRLPQICGGPIEVAVITTDRRFRWVKHKSWDSAIREGETDG